MRSVKGSLRQDLFLVLLVEVFEDVDRVVGIEPFDRRGDLLVRHVLDDLLADRIVDLGQRGEVELVAHEADELRTLLRLKRDQQIAELRLVQPADVGTQELRVPVLDCLFDAGEIARIDPAFLVIDVGTAGFGNLGMDLFFGFGHRNHRAFIGRPA